MEKVSMKRTPAEKKARETVMTQPYTGDDYPWGMRLNLGKEECEKLGLKPLDVGAELEMQATVRVVRVSAEDGEGMGKSMSIELLVTEMALAEPVTGPSAADAMYGDTKKG